MRRKILISIILTSFLFCGTEKKDNNRDLLLFFLLTAEPSFPAGPYSKYLYTVNRGSSDIYAYKVDVNTGGLVQINTVKTDRSPSSLVVNFAGSKVDSDGLFAYVSNQGSNSISGYTINKADGKIDPISGNSNNTIVAGNVGTQPSSLAFDPTGYYLAVSNSGSDNVRIYTFNSTTGAITPTTGTSLVGVDTNSQNGLTSTNADDDSSPISVVFHPTARVAYSVNFKADTISVFDFDLATPAAPLTLDSALQITVNTVGQAGAAPRDLAFEPKGRFAYLTNFRDNSLTFFRTEMNPSSSDYGKLIPISITTPVVQLEGTVASQNPLPLKLEGFTDISPYKALVDPNGRFLYVLYFAARKIALFQLDTFTGIPSFITTYDTGINPSALALDQSGRFLYVTNSGTGTISIYAVNPSNGRLKGIGTVNTGIEPVDIRLY